jgi:hypothetical protein
MTRALPILLAVVLATPPSLAQPTQADTAAARALFTEGRELAQREDWPAAVDRFRRALGLRPSPAIRYNLAASLVHVGKLVEASELCRAVLRDAPERDPARAPAQALLREIEPQLVQLTINLEGDAAAATVLLDGEPFSAERIGVATPIDPGAHTIVVRRGRQEATRRIDLAPGGEAGLTLTVPIEAAVSAPDAADPPATAAERQTSPDEAMVPRAAPVDRPEPSGLRWPLVLAGVGLVGVGVVLDLAPASARNGRTDGLDFVPVGLYVAGAAVTIIGLLQQ